VDATGNEWQHVYAGTGQATYCMKEDDDDDSENQAVESEGAINQ
jgi:hypothetical protein